MTAPTAHLSPASAPVFVFRGLDPDLADCPPDEHALRALVANGRTAWIIQTWARFRHAGLPATLSATLPDSGLAVLHADDFAAFDPAVLPANLCTVVCRADRPPVWRADFEIVQNPTQADGRRAFYVHHWTQPGLLPRDPERGTALRNAAYYGMFKHLPPLLQSEEWPRRIRSLGLEWVMPGNVTSEAPIDFSRLHDYSTIDLVLALRDPARGPADHKPPTKLLNAWLAGIPAIVSPESAYRALRTSELDFIEAADPGEALAAIVRLRDDHALYAAMCRRALVRAAEVAPAATTAHWHRLLTTEIPARRRGVGSRLAHFFRRHARGGQRLSHRLNRHRFRHYDLP